MSRAAPCGRPERIVPRAYGIVPVLRAIAPRLD
jgi:hypothetical protein